MNIKVLSAKTAALVCLFVAVCWWLPKTSAMLEARYSSDCSSGLRDACADRDRTVQIFPKHW